MNWYFLYKFAFDRNKNDILSSNIGRRVFTLIKQNFGKDFAIDITDIKNSCKISLVVMYIETDKMDYKLRYNFFDVAASFNAPKDKSFAFFDPFIRIELTLINKFSSNNFPGLYYVVMDAIRHEVEHYNIYKNTKKSLADNDMPYGGDYLGQCNLLKNKILSEEEIVPYLRGLVFSAKKQKRPFPQVLNDNLSSLFFYNNDIKREMTAEEIRNVNAIIKEIKSKVISRAQQIFPKLRM